MKSQTPKFYRRREAAKFVREVLNQPCTKTLLERLACTDDEGPEFVYLDGHWPLYSEESLRSWAESRLTKRRRKSPDPSGILWRLANRACAIQRGAWLRSSRCIAWLLDRAVVIRTHPSATICTSGRKVKKGHPPGMNSPSRRCIRGRFCRDRRRRESRVAPSWRADRRRPSLRKLGLDRVRDNRRHIQ
jgi:hypothetical protein